MNGTRYTEAENLEITTLENAVYMNIKNDISFIFSFYMNLYEHQSTMNRNIPFRMLLYVSDLLQKKYYGPAVYRETAMKLKSPKFVVFYNGVEEVPDKTEYRLSELYENQGEEPELELRVTVLNINKGHNLKLLERCKTLKDYAEFVSLVREFREKYQDTDRAVNEAVEECIRKDILKEFLQRNKAEVVKVSIYEYDEEAVLAAIREESEERGRKCGEEIGWKRGKEMTTIELACKKLKKGMSVKEIADLLEEDEIRIQLIADAARKVTPPYNAEAIYEEIAKVQV